MHLFSSTPVPPPRRRRRSDCRSLPPALQLLMLLLALRNISPCLADSARSSEIPLSPHLVPIQIAPGLVFLETPLPHCGHPDASPEKESACRFPEAAEHRDAFVSFTPDQRELLHRRIVPALLVRGPQVLQLGENPAPPDNADVCREVGGSAAGVALYVAPLVGTGGAAEAVRCAAAVVLRLRPDALDASETAAAAALLLSKALGIDDCPDTDAVLLHGVSADGDVRGVCVSLRCGAGERVEVRPTGAAHWTDCAEGLLPIACPDYADICSAPPVSARRPVKKRHLSAFGESDGLTHTVKESAPPRATENETAKNITNHDATRSSKSAQPADTRLRLRQGASSDGSNTPILTASWALLVLFLAMS